MRLLSSALATAVAIVLVPVTAQPAAAAERWHVPKKATITIKGHGYGHGRGMSQYGAEGAARQGTGEFLQFLSVAKGSLAEMETHLVLAGRLGYLAAEERARLLGSAAEIGRMLSGLTRSLRSKR